MPDTAATGAFNAVALRARTAATQLALATRDVKDTALLAMADALVAGSQAILEANAADVQAAECRRDTPAHGRPAPARRLARRGRWPRGCATWPACPTRSVRWCAAPRWPTGCSCARCGCRSASSGSSTRRGPT